MSTRSDRQLVGSLAFVGLLSMASVCFGVTLTETFDSPDNPFDGLNEFCERIYNVRWNGSQMVAFNSNCCVDADEAGNTEFGYGGCGTAGAGTSGNCCPGAPGGTGTLPCHNSTCAEVSTTYPMSDPLWGAYYLISKQPQPGNTRHVEVDFSLSGQDLDPPHEHVGIYVVARNNTNPSGIEAFVRPDEVGGNGYQMQIIVGGGNCVCFSGCIPMTCISLAPTSPSETFDIDLNQFCTLALDSTLIAAGGPGQDVVGVTAEISGGCIVGGGTFTESAIILTDFGYYNSAAQKFALAGTRVAPNVTIYDNFFGSATP